MRPHRLAGRALTNLAGTDATERAAALLAVAAAGGSFAPGLLPRGAADQAAVMGVVVAAEYGVVVTVQSLLGGVVQAGLRRASERLAATLAADVALAVAGAGLEASLRPRPAESARRAALRTAGRFAARVGVAGALVALVESAEGRTVRGRSRAVPAVTTGSGVVLGGIIAAARIGTYRRTGPGITGEHDQEAGAEHTLPPLGRTLAAGLAVAAGLQGAAAVEAALARAIGRRLARVVPSTRQIATAGGHAVVTAVLAAGVLAGVEAVHRRAEAGGGAIEPGHLAAPASPAVSGGPASALAWADLSREGMRFVALAVTRAELAATGAGADRDPVRVFVPLAAGDDVDARVTLAMEELERLGGLERSVLCLASPTGSGYVNHVVLETLEFLTGGDCATVAMQYSLRPSFLSLDRVALGREQNRALLHALAWRLRGLPEGRRPRLVAFGESLGAQTLQDAVLHEGAPGLRRADVDAALFVGTPAGSGWARRWRASPAGSDPDGEVVEVASIEEWEELGAGRQDAARVVLLSRHDDPIVRLEPALAVQRPGWLGPPEGRPPGVPRQARWYPFVTFLLTVVDTKNALDVVPGVFVSRGHDYRADLVRAVATTYRLPASPEELRRLDLVLREREREWARHRLVAEQLHRAREAVTRQLAAWGPLHGVPDGGTPGGAAR
jgi:uncharacterized membrane protein